MINAKLDSLCLRLCSIALTSLLLPSYSYSEEENNLAREFELSHKAQIQVSKYAAGMMLTGKRAREAIDIALGQGFSCGLRELLVSPRKGSDPILQKRQQILCSKWSSEIDHCPEITFAFDVNWTDPSQPKPDLIRQLDALAVTKVIATCGYVDPQSRPDSPVRRNFPKPSEPS